MALVQVGSERVVYQGISRLYHHETLGVDGEQLNYAYQCRELSGENAGTVWCKLPPIKTLVGMECQGRDKAGYVKEGYAFSPMFTLGYTGTLKEKEAFTTWLKLKRAD